MSAPVVHAATCACDWCAIPSDPRVRLTRFARSLADRMAYAAIEGTRVDAAAHERHDRWARRFHALNPVPVHAATCLCECCVDQFN